jgi:NitT/TauT family transport system substrate-binding protein
MYRSEITRRAAIGSIAALPMITQLWPTVAQSAVPETPNLRVGLAVEGTAFLPLYVAAGKTWHDQGINGELFSFRGDPDVAQALIGGSVDIHLGSLTGLLNLISANQPVMGFYAGFDQADLAWLAQPAIRNWSDLKGKTIGISTLGSLTDALTQFVLRKHGLQPLKDVQLMQVGGTTSAYQALRANRIDAAIMSSPYKWVAQDEGFTLLGTQTREVAPQWPKHVFITTKTFLDRNPNTLRAVLRAHVEAIRMVKSDRAMSVQLLVNRLKYTQPLAERAYEETVIGLDERGRLPIKSMPAFWNISIANNDVKAPLPDSRFLDDRFLKSFPIWSGGLS